jgi:hypothetical protein
MSTADDFRRLALALPETEERETWGHPTFRVRAKMFGGLAPDGTSAGLKASLEQQAALVGGDPATYSVAAYTGRYGWIDLRLGNVPADELRELVEEAWRQTAPKRVVAAYERGA